MDHRQYQYLDIDLESLTVTKKLQKLDEKTRKLLTIHGQHHRKPDVDRLYVPRKQGGRGLMQLEAAHAREITKLVDNVDRKEDTLIHVTTHQHNTASVESQRARCLKTEVLKETRKVKDSIAEKTKGRWQGKRMHGQFPRKAGGRSTVISLAKIW